MNIAYLITSTRPIGGAQVHVRDLAQSMMRLGHKVWILHGGADPLPGVSPDIQVCLPALVRQINPLSDVKAYWQIRSVLHTLQPQILSTHSSKAGWLGRLAAHSLGIPVVFTAHGWAFTEGVPQPHRSVYLWAERLVAPLSSCIVTVSNYDRELAIRCRVGSPDTLITIHNGMPDIDPSLRARPWLNPPRLVMVARFGPQKDHATLLQALVGLQDHAWTLDLIGDGDGRQAVEELVQRLGLTERIRFLGSCEDVGKHLALAQLFLLISRWEGLPRSILEAMRAGLPVIASDVGGVREAVEHGKTGLLVRSGDVTGLRMALEQFLTQPELRRDMGEAGRARYEAHFTFERMVTETLGVYERVLNEHEGNSELRHC